MRTEMDDRDFNANTGKNTYTYLRTRFSANMRPKDNLSAFIQIQDSRVYGSEPSTLGSTANVDLHQAYFSYAHGNRLQVTIGRMEINWGDQRLIGAVGWSNVGRSLDAITGGLKFSDKASMTVLAAKLEEASLPAAAATPALALNPSDKADQELIAARLILDLKDYFKTMPYFISMRDHTVSNAADLLNLYTFGTYVFGQAANWTYKAEVAYQYGDNSGFDISAYMLTGAVQYTWRESKWKPVLGVGIDYLSGGTDPLIDPAKDKIKAFNTLLATNHKFYGAMDYFISIPAHTHGLGLQDLHAGMTIAPSSRIQLGLDVHHFSSAAKSGGKDAFGDEIDLSANYVLNENYSWSTGYSMFLPGNLMKSGAFFGSKDIGTWAYLSALFKF